MGSCYGKNYLTVSESQQKTNGSLGLDHKEGFLAKGFLTGWWCVGEAQWLVQDQGEKLLLSPRGPREESPSLSYLACSLLVSPNQRPEGLRDEIHSGQPPRTQEVDNGGQSR